MISRRLLATLIGAFCAAGLALPALASASHEQGGSVTARITALGRLQGTVNYLTTGTCTVGGGASLPSATVMSPANVSRSITLSGTYTRCLPGSTTATANFDVDLSTVFSGNAPDGAYLVTFSSCCRVGGIQNVSSSNTLFRAQVTKNGLNASSAPVLNSMVANTIPIGYDYEQNLNASDPDGSALTYSSRAGLDNGPATDVVSLSQAGVVSIAQATTTSMANGSYYVYTVRVTDATGDFSERDVLLKASNTNAPPSINGLPGAPVAATAGGSAQTVNFTADDPNNANPKIDTVGLSLVGAPSWVGMTAPAGNPVNGSLTINPPASVPTGTYGFNVDGVDSDSTSPLFASENVQVQVTNALPETTLGGSPAAQTASTSGSFAFSSDDNGATFECKLDTDAWAACTSPASYSGLAEGSHTFRVRAVDAAQQLDASPATHTWTIDTTPPAVPAVSAKPAAVSATSTFEFDTPAGGADECQVDGGAWVTCTSPFTASGLGDGAHTFAVRSYDGAGNRSASTPASWQLDATAPAAPKLDQSPSAYANTSTFAFAPGTGETAECRLDDGAWVACTSPFVPVGLADGAHTFSVRYGDAAGNRSQAATTSWTLDTTAPAAPAFTSGPVGSTSAKTASFDWTSEPGASFECQVDGGAWAACAAPYALTGLKAGKHSFAVRQTDAAGNAGAAGVTEWTVGDDPAPADPPKSVAPVLGQNATVAVKGDSASVGCQVDGGRLASCIVDVYARLTGGGEGFGLAKTTAASDGLVKIGTGRVTAKNGAARLAVDITLNALGRKLMATNLAGVDVVLKIEAKTIEGPKLRVRKNAKLVPAHQLIVPTEGLFASGKAKIQPGAKKLLAQIAKQVGRVKAVRCIGHTDSLGTASANEKLGFKRARAVCAALRSYGVRAAMSVASAGERQPRATNGSVRGRSLNRRVEISVRYR